MRTWAAALYAMSIVSGPTARAADGPARTFAPHDLFELQFAADPQMRPDGREIAYVRVGYDAMSD
jgi:hypothetical protein